MYQKLTHSYLRARFWAANMVLLAGFASAIVVVVLLNQAQEAQGRYDAAFNRLSERMARTLLEFAELNDWNRLAERGRSDAISDYIELLTIYSALQLSDSDGAEPSDLTVAESPGDKSLERIIAEFAIDPVQAADDLGLKPGAMPKALAVIWETPDFDQAESGASPVLALEATIGRFLRLAEPLVQGHGALDLSEREILVEIEALDHQRIHPTISRVGAILQHEFERIARSSALVLIGCLVLGMIGTLFNYLVIFRPIIGAVMTGQAGIIAERDRAIAADVAKRNFLSVVSHEIRTPMNGVLGFASLLASSDLKPEHRKHVEIIQSSGKSLLTLVNDILDFSKLEAGSLDLEDEDFSIEDVLAGVVTLLRGAARAKRLELSVFFDARLPEKSRGDGNRLRQVLTNLVGNAIKFTDSGNIGIEAHEVSGADSMQGGCELQFAVSDTGIGISADRKDEIFDRFTQIDASAKRKFEGTGLGLVICKQLVERMGGRIWVDSMPGNGSTFFVRIPLAAPIPPVSESAWHANAVAKLSGRRVLVVDDHSINRRIFRLQLESYGLLVDDAAGADDAWQLLEHAADTRDPFAMAILDHMMPGIDGIELAQRIRTDGRFAQMRLLLSSSAGAGDLAEARRLGFDAVEEKPVLPRDLINALCALTDDIPGVGRDAQNGAAAGQIGTDFARILLVEDNRVGEQLALEMLSRGRYRVDTVPDGLEAVRAVAKLPYDLILMDIRMPILGGVDATRRIRAMSGAAGRTPIIALTANVQVEDVAEYYAIGMQNVVEKPVDGEILLAAVDAALDAGPEAVGGLAGAGAAPKTGANEVVCMDSRAGHGRNGDANASAASTSNSRPVDAVSGIAQGGAEKAPGASSASRTAAE